MNWVAITVFVGLFLFVTGIGFFAGRWRRGDLSQLHEWGLGGRRFGTFVTWFLLGGDLYTAYTFIAVPALMFGAGAVAFFAVPYTVMIYPILYLAYPRLWRVAQRHGYVTSADFVRGRFGNRWLALAVALTGLLATMPYIALQLVGMQVVIGAMGVETTGIMGDLPLIIAFVILAAFTYSSGLARAGDDRGGQGRVDLHHGHRRNCRGAAATRRLRGDLCQDPAGQAAAGTARSGHVRLVQRLRDAGARLGAGAVPLPAFHDSDPEFVERAGDPA